MPSVLAQESVTPYIAMLNESRLGMPSRTLLLEAGTDGGKKKPIQSTRNRPVTGECITTGQRLRNQAGSTLVELLFNDPEVVTDPNGPVAEQLASDPMLRKRGLRQGTVTPQMVQPCTWFKHARHSERTRSDA